MAPAPSAADMQHMIDLLKNPNIEIDLDNFEWEQHGIAGNGGQAESNAEHPRDSDKDSDNEPDKDSDNESDGDSDSDSEFDDDKYWPKLGSDSDSVNEPGRDLPEEDADFAEWIKEIQDEEVQTSATTEEIQDEEVQTSATTAEAEVIEDQPKKVRRRLLSKLPPEPEQVLTIEQFAAERNLMPIEVGRLLRMGMPMLFLNILFYLALQNPLGAQDLFMVEFYAGQGVVADAFTERGYKSKKFDIRYDAIQQDALSPRGFLYQIELATRMKRCKSVSTWGTVCSTWIYLSRAATGRSSVRPLGWEEREPVRAGNVQVCRMTLLLLFLYCTSRHWLLEQPGTSVMKRAPWPRWLWRQMQTFFTHTWLCMFGGATMKSTELVSGSAWTTRLHRTRNTAEDSRWLAITGVRHEMPDSNGRIRISGAAGLKESQEYPKAFGEAIAEEFLEKGGMQENIEAFDPQMPELDWQVWHQARQGHPIDWGYAKLWEVAEMLNLPMHQPMRRH